MPSRKRNKGRERKANRASEKCSHGLLSHPRKELDPYIDDKKRRLMKEFFMCAGASAILSGSDPTQSIVFPLTILMIEDCEESKKSADEIRMPSQVCDADVVSFIVSRSCLVKNKKAQQSQKLESAITAKRRSVNGNSTVPKNVKGQIGRLPTKICARTCNSVVFADTSFSAF